MYVDNQTGTSDQSGLRRSARKGSKTGAPDQKHEDVAQAKPESAMEKARQQEGQSERNARRKVPAKRKRDSDADAVEKTPLNKSKPPKTENNSTADRQYWLLKAEPESRIEKGKDVKFSIDDLQACTVPEPWTGVRNHVAKNNMLAMKKGDLAFFYHSSCKVPGIVGIMQIVQEATPDLSAFDSKDPYYDEKSDRAKPRWFNVHVEHRTTFDHAEHVTLTELRKHAADGPLANMALVKQSRLSVTRVTPAEWNYILDLLGEDEYKYKSSDSA